MTQESGKFQNRRRKPSRSKSRGNSSKRRGKGPKPTPWLDGAVFESKSLDDLSFLSKNISEVEFTVFDIETTGGNPERNGITEIFGVKYIGGEGKDTFYSMVNPEIPIPRIVRKMTGITNSMVKDAPKIEEVMKGIIDFIGTSVLVSHNTIGDLKFLKYFAYKCEKHNLNNFFLCTHLLSEKLISEAPDKSLKGLCEFLGFSQDTSHRAEADTYMTLDLFKELVKRLESVKGITKLENAIRFQSDIDSALRLGWGVDESTLSNITNSSGLFYLYDRDNNLLFYSSSQNVSKDVKSLSKYGQLPRQLLRKVLNTYKIETKSTDHFLEAFIEEVTDHRKEKMHYKPSQWHLRMIHVIQAVKEGDKYLVSVGRPRGGAEFLYGKVYDRKEAFDLIRKISDAVDVPFNRKGFYLDQEKFDIVKKYLEDDLGALNSEIAKKKWNPIFWLRSKQRSETSDKKSLISKLAELPRVGMKNLNNINGFVIVGEPKSKKGEQSLSANLRIYPVVASHIMDFVEHRGTFKDWYESKESEKFKDQMRKAEKSAIIPSGHEGRLNVGLWLATAKLRKSEVDYRFESFKEDE